MLVNIVDSNSPPLSTYGYATVRVLDVNEKPKFNKSSYTFNVYENATDGFVLGVVNVTDPEGAPLSPSRGVG